MEAERSNTATIKADHIKQHKMHKNQIRDLKEKLAKTEVYKYAILSQPNYIGL